MVTETRDSDMIHYFRVYILLFMVCYIWMNIVTWLCFTTFGEFFGAQRRSPAHVGTSFKDIFIFIQRKAIVPYLLST